MLHWKVLERYVSCRPTQQVPVPVMGSGECVPTQAMYVCHLENGSSVPPLHSNEAWAIGLFWCGRLRQFEALSVARPFCVSANLRRSITMQFLGSHVCEIQRSVVWFCTIETYWTYTCFEFAKSLCTVPSQVSMHSPLRGTGLCINPPVVERFGHLPIQIIQFFRTRFGVCLKTRYTR